eukprot:4650668-Amphidinium_carterae.2
MRHNADPHTIPCGCCLYQPCVVHPDKKVAAPTFWPVHQGQRHSRNLAHWVHPKRLSARASQGNPVGYNWPIAAGCALLPAVHSICGPCGLDTR